MSKQYHISSAVAQQVSCPRCAHVIYYYDDKSTYFGCPECLCFFRKDDDGDTRFMRQFLSDNAWNPALQPGSKGTINDREYQVAGMLLKEDYSGSQWREYLLTSPGQTNYHILSEYSGQWIFLWPVDANTHRVTRGGAGAFYREVAVGEDQDEIFERYQTYKFRVLYAIGEFDWDAPAEAGVVKAREYIRPPDMLTVEMEGDKESWFRGTHINGEDIRKGFGLAYGKLPVKYGNGPLDVPGYYKRIGPLIRFSLIAAAVLLLSRILISGVAPAETVLSNYFEIPADSALTEGVGNALRTESFRLSRDGAVELSVVASLDNNWMDVEAELVNEKSGRSWECARALQYYHGVEGGESWSEGPNNMEAVFSSVPAGNYHVNVVAYGEALKPKTLSVSVEQNTSMDANFWWTFLVIAAYPAILLLRKSAFESEKNQV